MNARAQIKQAVELALAQGITPRVRYQTSKPWDLRFRYGRVVSCGSARVTIEDEETGARKARDWAAVRGLAPVA